MSVIFNVTCFKVEVCIPLSLALNVSRDLFNWTLLKSHVETYFCHEIVIVFDLRSKINVVPREVVTC